MHRTPALLGASMLALAVLGNPTATRAAQPAKLTACSLIPDSDAKAFAAGKYDRSEMSETSCVIEVMEGEYFNRHLFLSITRLPPEIPKYPDFAKDSVSQSADNAKRSGGKPLQCTIAGATHFACLDVSAPMGSFKPGQRAVQVLAGKGNTSISLTLFHDKRPNLEVAKELAEKIVKRLP
jgi:hypothetical protein